VSSCQKVERGLPPWADLEGHGLRNRKSAVEPTAMVRSRLRCCRWGTSEHEGRMIC
jgi:hypothetical protein